MQESRPGSGPAAPPYASGERVFGPPQGTFDVEWAARLLAERVPGLPWAASWRLAQAAWDALRAVGRPDRDAVERGLVAGGVPAGLARDGADVAVALAEAYGVDLTG